MSFLPTSPWMRGTRFNPDDIGALGSVSGGIGQMAAVSPVDAGGDFPAPVRHHMPNHVPVPTPRTATGMFGAKPRSRGQVIAGIFGDFMAGMGGRQGQFAPMMAAEREREQALGLRQADREYEESTYQRRRGEILTDWRAKEDYERANPAPRAPTDLQQNYEYLKGVDPRLAETYLRTRAETPGSMAGMGFINVPNANGGQSVYGYSKAGAPAPAQATSKGQYDALPPGAEFIAPDGSRRRKPGGAGPQSPRTFRP